MSGRALFLVLLTGCAGIPFPEKCREVGVAVQDTDIITGSIIKAIEVKDARTLCQRPFDEISYGCTLGVGEKEYYIVYASSTARIHEECHALYEKFDHMW